MAHLDRTSYSFAYGGIDTKKQNRKASFGNYNAWDMERMLTSGIYPKRVVKKSSEQTEISIALQAVNEGYTASAPTMRAFGDTRTEYDKNNIFFPAQIN
jgi:hypothetical protein